MCIQPDVCGYIYYNSSDSQKKYVNCAHRTIHAGHHLYAGKQQSWIHDVGLVANHERYIINIKVRQNISQ